MRIFTYGQLKTQIEDESNLHGEDLVSAEEMMAYCNDAISEAEAEIHRLNLEDQYFLTSTVINVPTGCTEIDFPADTYANKIVSVICKECDRTYKIKQVKANLRYDRFERILNAFDSDDYCYIIRNALVPKLMIFPPVRDPGVTLTVWYIRSAKRVTDDDTVIDIPEFDTFITAFMKAKCMAKENMGETPISAKQDVSSAKKLMVDTLANRVMEEPDLDPFMEHYEFHA